MLNYLMALYNMAKEDRERRRVRLGDLERNGWHCELLDPVIQYEKTRRTYTCAGSKKAAR